MKITNVDVQNETGLSHDQLYRLQNKHPKVLELVKKGMIAEKMLDPSVFARVPKKKSKRF